MAKARTLVGLDVHATKVVAAVLDVETGELAFFAMTADIARVAGFCAGLPGPVRAAYEAGPTGYGLARELARREVQCVVAAPSKIPRGSGERVKTDRRDAELLARLLLAGKLHPVRVPGREEAALRDLIRAREAVRVDLMRCRHRLSKLLLRHGIRFEDGDAWTTRHQQWLSTITLEQPAAQATLLDARGAVDALVHRREQLEREIIALLPGSPWSVQSSRLRCMRGLDTLSAVGLCAEVGDFASFRKPAQLMSYLGLVPSETSTRPAAQARVDHQDRLHARAPVVGRGGLALPQTPADRHHPHRSTSWPATRGDRDRLVRAAPPASHLDTIGAAQQTPHPDRRRRRSRPRARRVLLGDLPDRITRQNRNIIPSAGSVAARHARGTRDTPLSNRPRRPRSPSDSGSPRRTNGPASPSRQSAYISLTRVAHKAGPPPTQPTTPHFIPTSESRKFATQPLTHSPPYQAW